MALEIGTSRLGHHVGLRMAISGSFETHTWVSYSSSTIDAGGQSVTHQSGGRIVGKLYWSCQVIGVADLRSADMQTANRYRIDSYLLETPHEIRSEIQDWQRGD